MKKLILIGLLLMPIPVLAQQPEPQFDLKVNNSELGLIGKGLGSLPFNDVAGLLNKLQQQVIEQQKAAEVKKEPEKPVDNATKSDKKK